MLDVALVTCTAFPDGDADDHVLVAALRRLGLSVEFVCWDDPDARWAVAGVAVVRSTWDYHERLDAFIAWADYVGSMTTLRNTAATIRWNSHKQYLLELEQRGVDVVPTRLVRAGDRIDLGPGDHVVKPAVSVGALRTTRFASQADVDALTRTDDTLVQPYVATIETAGEVSVVCVAGAPMHAVRKVPASGDFRSQEHHGAAIEAIAVDPAYRALAAAALAGLPDPPLYARVDLVDTDRGPLLMELELIEPTLWLRWHPPTADALAAAIAALLTQGQ